MSTKVSQITGLLFSLAIIAGGMIAVYKVEDFLEHRRAPLPVEWADEDLSVRAGKIRGFAFGAEGLLADWYWMRSLQYIGDKLVSADSSKINIEDLQPLNPRLLYPYLDTATDLDPQFIPAYTYGAVVLPAIDPELAIKLCNKGIANNPDAWRLYQYLGYIYWRLERYDEASKTYEAGARIPGAAPFMQLMVGAMRTKGGSRDTAREIYTQMALDGSDSQTQYYAQFRLMQLDSLDEQDTVRAALKTFQGRTGRCISNWSELLPILKTVKLPLGKDFHIDAHGQIVDPSGVPYLLVRERCDVSLNFLETKVPTR